MSWVRDEQTTLSYYEVLGVRPDAGQKEIRDAYLARTRVCHPDRHAGPGQEVLQAANDTMQLLNRAYAVLGDPESRRRYDDSLASGGGQAGPEAIEVEPAVTSVDGVQPGQPVSLSLEVRAVGGWSSGEPTVTSADPMIRVGSRVESCQGNTAWISVRLDTGQLQGDHSYLALLIVRWGAAVGVTAVEMKTVEASEASAEEEGGRPPRAGSTPHPGRGRRWSDLAWAGVSGLLAPVALLVWSLGPSGPSFGWRLALVLASACWLGVSLRALYVTRGLRRFVQEAPKMSLVAAGLVPLGRGLAVTAAAAAAMFVVVAVVAFLVGLVKALLALAVVAIPLLVIVGLVIAALNN